MNLCIPMYSLLGLRTVPCTAYGRIFTAVIRYKSDYDPYRIPQTQDSLRYGTAEIMAENGTVRLYSWVVEIQECVDDAAA